MLAVRAQASWPGPGQQIFCLRERELDPAEPLEHPAAVQAVASSLEKALGELVGDVS